MSFLAFRAQAYTLVLVWAFAALHKIHAKAFASNPEAGRVSGKYLDDAHALLQLAARHVDRATPHIKTPVLASAGGPKPK